MTEHSDESPTMLDALLHSRYSCRAYIRKEVDYELIRYLVERATTTASWCNVQPWQLAITTTRACTDAFRHALHTYRHQCAETSADVDFPVQYEGVYGQRRRQAGFGLYDALGIRADDHKARDQQAQENFNLFDAPHVLIVCVPKNLMPYALVDIGGFINTYQLLAKANGIASVVQASLARYSRFIRRYFDISEAYRMVCGISFGYADSEHPINSFRTTRASLDHVAKFY